MNRWALAVLCALALAAPLSAVEGFESGLGGWSGSGLWHRVLAPACVTPYEGNACIYFGQDSSCDYNDHLIKDASFTSAPVTLSSTATAFISFWMLYDVESFQPSCYDQIRLERSSDGSTWSLLRKLSPGADPAGGGPGFGDASGSGVGGTPLWQFYKVDLSAFVPGTLYVRFRFISSASLAGDPFCGPADADLDDQLGVALDEIRFGENGPDVSLSKSVSPPFGAPGSLLTYTLVATNNAGVAQPIQVWDTIPTGMLRGSEVPAASLSGSTLSWSTPSLPAGGAFTMEMRVQADPSVAAPLDHLNSAFAQGGSGGAQDSGPVLFKRRDAGLHLSHSAAPSNITSGDFATYSLLVENYSAVTQSALALNLQLPSGLVFSGSYPSLSAAYRWDLFPLLPGGLRSFSLWGRGFGEDGAVLTVNGQLTQSGAVVDQRTASVTVKKPIEPTVRLKGVYPNPAPSDNAAFPPNAYVYYETNIAMPMTLDIFTVAGEKVRSLDAPGARGAQQVAWDLKNEWGQPVASAVYAFRLWSRMLVIPTPEVFGFIAVLR